MKRKLVKEVKEEDKSGGKHSVVTINVHTQKIHFDKCSRENTFGQK